MNSPVRFETDKWSNVSKDAKVLIRKLLNRNVSDRPSARDAMEDVWIKDTAPDSTDKAVINGEVLSSMRRFRYKNKVKQLALQIIAGQLEDEHIKTLREKFVALDVDNTGKLTADKIRMGIENSGLSKLPDDLELTIQSLSGDGSGQIDYSEFLAAALDRSTYGDEAVCYAAFRALDKTGSGRIRKDQLESMIEKSGGDSSDALNHDNSMSFPEFLDMMRAKTMQPDKRVDLDDEEDEEDEEEK